MKTKKGEIRVHRGKLDELTLTTSRLKKVEERLFLMTLKRCSLTVLTMSFKSVET
ncbi:MAG: hypothetical protein K9W46_10065 [Candidatus Heimdallarchaeum endolithica]|uniref:Uncharacterized protein n=1 Tax=Candidatus Heimdallarchaeum endolithica TaxID=2876572 RepID=A0A9Y1BPC5_9ARCH|nr:MAG: hypothetical protein K9W46_10065 [Candidatus Heimdallarchaeum endolithica]